MDRQEYPTMLATLQPNQAIDVLHDRVRQVGSLNTHIADWLQERRRLEDQYSSGLKKLARRPPPGDANDLGIFSVPWHTLTNALESIADSHHAFANKIESDVEKPLRNFATTNREMQAMSTIQGNLASLARDIETAGKRSDRLAHKGQRANTANVANANNELDMAQSQWDNQAPYVFEQLQAVDESRLNQLRDILTQFQTHEVDRVEKDRALAEQCLNVILNVETADEIKTFALRIAQGERPATSQTQRNRQSIIGSSIPSLAPSQSRIGDDAASQRSGSIPNDPEKKSGGLKGLKRGLGTVLGRRKDNKAAVSGRGASESPERKAKGASAFNSFSNRLGRGRDLPTPLEDEETPRPSSPLRTVTSASEREPIDGSAQSLAAAGMLSNGDRSNSDYRSRPTSQMPQTHQSDVAQLQEPLQPTIVEPSQSTSQAFDAPRDNDGFSVPPPQLDAISQAQREAADMPSPALNVNIRQAPIAEEPSDSELATMASSLKMQAPPPTSRRAGTLRGRRDLRASVYGPSPNAMTPEPAIEDSGTSPWDIAPSNSPTPAAVPFAAPPTVIAQAFPEVAAAPAHTLAPTPISTYGTTAGQLSETQSPSSPAFSTANTTRGDGTFSPYHGSAAATAASIFGPTSAVGQGLDHDSQSIRSGRSLSSSTSQGISKHPDLTGTGLNFSVIETVSAWFEHGLCTRSVVIGEVALAYNAPDYNSPFGRESIRLKNFERLEKVAPNPAFISDSSVKGEYYVKLSHIQRTNVAFKYQLASSTGAAAGEHAPMLINTAWKMDTGAAMCIVSYSLNPSYINPAGPGSPTTLSNVTLLLRLAPDSGKAQSCQSKPVGTFDRTKNIIYWTLNDVVLSSTPQKLLAKFVMPDGEAKAGPVEAKWDMLVSAAGSGLAVSVRDEGDKEADPFADENSALEGTWRAVEGVKKVSAGTYTTH